MKNLFNILVLVVFSMPVQTIQAQETQTESIQAQDEIFIAVVKIDSATCIAHTREEYKVLQTTNDLVNTLKRVKARKGIDQDEYNSRVTMLLNGAEAMGVTIIE